VDLTHRKLKEAIKEKIKNNWDSEFACIFGLRGHTCEKRLLLARLRVRRWSYSQQKNGDLRGGQWEKANWKKGRV